MRSSIRDVSLCGTFWDHQSHPLWVQTFTIVCIAFILLFKLINCSQREEHSQQTQRLAELGSSMSHSQRISSNPYAESNQSNSGINIYFFNISLTLPSHLFSDLSRGIFSECLPFKILKELQYDHHPLWLHVFPIFISWMNNTSS